MTVLKETTVDSTIDLTLRLPPQIHTQLLDLKKRRSHMSLNALIVEAIVQSLSSQTSESAREMAKSLEEARS
jgi:predicted HicB family RNase H-like nuclease